jgi:hypothetical protein
MTLYKTIAIMLSCFAMAALPACANYSAPSLEPQSGQFIVPPPPKLKPPPPILLPKFAPLQIVQASSVQQNGSLSPTIASPAEGSE